MIDRELGSSRQLAELRPTRLRAVVAGADVRKLLLTDEARLVRFTLVGAVCGLLQLVLFATLKFVGLPPIPANIAAYLLSAQVNFVLSNCFIWHDRRSGGVGGRDLAQRWLGFHGSIAGTFLLSQAVFISGRLLLPDLIASALGIGVSAAVNFFIQDRFAFRRLSPRRS
jgi:putative flippase GtrA